MIATRLCCAPVLLVWAAIAPAAPPDPARALQDSEDRAWQARAERAMGKMNPKEHDIYQWEAHFRDDWNVLRDQAAGKGIPMPSYLELLYDTTNLARVSLSLKTHIRDWRSGTLPKSASGPMLKRLENRYDAYHAKVFPPNPNAPLPAPQPQAPGPDNAQALREMEAGVLQAQQDAQRRMRALEQKTQHRIQEQQQDTDRRIRELEREAERLQAEMNRTP